MVWNLNQWAKSKSKVSLSKLPNTFQRLFIGYLTNLVSEAKVFVMKELNVFLPSPPPNSIYVEYSSQLKKKSRTRDKQLKRFSYGFRFFSQYRESFYSKAYSPPLKGGNFQFCYIFPLNVCSYGQITTRRQCVNEQNFWLFVRKTLHQSPHLVDIK